LLQKLAAELKQEAEEITKNSKAQAKHTVDLESLHEQIQHIAEIHKKVSTEVDALDVEKRWREKEQDRTRITVQEQAVVFRPDPFKRQVIASSIATAGTLALVLFGLAWWEHRSLRVDSVDQVRQGLGVHVMGTLPMVPDRSRPSRFGFAQGEGVDWEYCLLESVDLLRTVLLHAAKTESLQVVMVTSALEGEGKTSLSSQLATSLARGGRNVLLIDGDMRKPCLHRVFDLPHARGLCEALRGEIAPAESIQATAVNGLSVLAAGECDDVALTALARGGVVNIFAEIFAEMRGQYDFILVDSAPVLPVADSLLLAQAADGVLMSLLRDVSRLGPVYAAQVRLAALSVRMLGAVLAGTRPIELYEHKYRYAGRVKRSSDPTESATEEEAS
jgi:capsular exopolysaccharide synthesis family protein